MISLYLCLTRITGIVKTYKLTYESVEIMHALFAKSAAPNGWTLSSRIMREYIEYFGPRTEQLDMLAKDGKAIFTSFTEKIMDGKGKCSSLIGQVLAWRLTHYRGVEAAARDSSVDTHRRF